MIQYICDHCKQKTDDRDFKFEGMVRQIKQVLTGNNPRPQLVEKVIHLCLKCYEKKLNL